MYAKGFFGDPNKQEEDTMLSHYLMFNRNCGEALRVYAEAFNGKIKELQTYGDMPADPNFPVAEADKNLVLHAKLALDDGEIMCADSKERTAQGQNMYVSITLGDAAYVQKAWNILRLEGEIYMELAPSFFAALHGSLRDRFGINWMFTATR